MTPDNGPYTHNDPLPSDIPEDHDGSYEDGTPRIFPNLDDLPEKEPDESYDPRYPQTYPEK